MTKKLILVETIATFRHVYAVESETKEEAENKVWANEIEEMGQDFLGEVVVSSREVNQKEYLRVFDELSDYLKDIDTQRKLEYISKNNLNK